MKSFRWNAEKNDARKVARGVSFENVVVSIEAVGLLDIVNHPNPARCPKQKVLVVTIDGYAYLVPFVDEPDSLFLKTIVPSRKATRDYLQKGERDVEN